MLHWFRRQVMALPYAVRYPILMLWRTVPPCDRRFLLQKLDAAPRRRFFLASPHYRHFADQEGRYWSSYDGPPAGSAEDAPVSLPTVRYALAHPLVRSELNRRAAPEAGDPWAWMAARCGGYRHGLVLGAGAGDHCRLLIDLKIARKVTGVDLAASAIERAKAHFARADYPIDYLLGDMNFLHLQAGGFDLCLAMQSLHHVIELEGLMDQLTNALEPAGLLCVEDYVGPRFLEFPASLRRAASTLLRELPEKLRKTRDGATVIRRLEFPDRWLIERDSPFEAIRSDSILPTIKSRFEIEVCHEMGGGLLMALLNPLIHNFPLGDPEADGWIERILAEDLRLTLAGEIPNCFVFLAARPQKKSVAQAFQTVANASDNG